MKKLILKCLLLLLAVGGLLRLGGEAYQQTTAYRNLERTEDTEKFHSVPESAGIAVFGASHGRDGFKYPPEGRTLFNFSLSSQTPEYDLRLMRQYQDRVRPGALAVLTVSPAYPFYFQDEESFAQLQPRYYRVLSPWNMVDPDWGYALRLGVSPLLTEDYVEIADAFLHPPPLRSTYDERTGSAQLQPEDVPSEKERIRKNHIAPVAATFPEESPVMTGAYREMLALCRENGWNAVLVVPPYTAEYLECFEEYSPDYFSVLEEFLDGLSKDFDVPYLDYSHDPAFTGRPELFRNIDHLNLDGAALFNQRFFSDVQALGLLG